MSDGNPSIRTWYVGAEPGFEVDPDDVAQMAIDVSTVQRMCGGTVTSGAEREELVGPEGPTGIFQTVAVWWRWHPFAPAVQREREEPAQQQQSGGGKRRRSRGRGRGNGGQPPAPVPAEREIAQAPIPQEPGGAFQNQPEPEPQEPDEAYEPDFGDESLPLTPEQEREIAAEAQAR